MAAPETRNVASMKPFAGGGVYRAPAGTALPTDATTTLAGGYVALGYVSEDGIKPSRDTSIDKMKAWGGDIVAALLTDDSRSFEFTLLEVFSGPVNQYLYGTANVTVTAAITGTGTKLSIKDVAYKPTNDVLVFEMKYNLKRRRIVIPIADATISGEEPYTDSGLSAYTVQVEALKDSTGTRVYDYMQNDDAL